MSDLGQPRLFVSHGPHAVLGDPAMFEQKPLAVPAFVRPLPKEGPVMSVAEQLTALTLQLQLLRVDVAEIKTILLAPPWYQRAWRQVVAAWTSLVDAITTFITRD